jgi:NADPH:quinone reductase-like Zn-dependent oxidoreductase/NADP-dependent 3-hydroxy acid dehydrogenase YdfG/acyl carrier protein
VPLWLVSAGAAAVDGEAGKPIFGAIGALRATLRAEFPEAVCRLIDLDPALAPAEAAAALALELAQIDEPEIALRGQLRHAPRLAHAPVASLVATDGELIELVPAESGLIDELSFRSRPRTAPKSHEVEIEVRATGLNFRDVLNALAMLPGAAPRLGGECAGVVVRAGTDSGFVPGDAVFSFCPGQSGSYVTVPAKDVARKPDGLDFAHAAGLPIAYMTAIYGLQHLAALQPGQSILIHAAAGGLGQAAVHIALASGATVYATAGNDAKRACVRRLGAAKVMSSRTLAFVDELLSATGGRGVDVVLNTLSGAFVPASFQVLAPNGRFLEVGKRGVFTPAEAQLHRPDASYFQFDLGTQAESDPALVPSLLRQLTEMLATRRVPPLPAESWPYADAKLALRRMAAARHVGKLVLLQGSVHKRDTSGGAYLITGGFGALGIRAAAWLAGRGARTVVLVGPRRKHLEAIAALEAGGTTVITVEADCADVAALRQIVADLHPEHSLRGVVHCAGSLEDELLPQQSAGSFERVASPKLAGALALHQATVHLDLESFVLFSSAAAIVGSPGQANYAAANATLGSIARARRSQGKAALCVDWGPWKEGMAGEERVRRRDLGMSAMTSQAGFHALEKLLDARTVQAVVLPIDSWVNFCAAQPSVQHEPLFAEVCSESEATQAPLEPGIAERLSTMPRDAARHVLLDHLRQQAARVLGIDPKMSMDPSHPLQERGLDSLMAVELRNLLAKSLNLTLPSTLVLDHSTPDALCDYLLGRLFVSEPAEVQPEDDVALIASLSEADAEAMLLRELEELDV